MSVPFGSMIKPFNEKVIVQLIKETKSASGLQYTSETMIDCRRGIVIAKGTNVIYELEENTIVYFHQFAGVDLGNGIKILDQEELLGKEVSTKPCWKGVDFDPDED